MTKIVTLVKCSTFSGTLDHYFSTKWNRLLPVSNKLSSEKFHFLHYFRRIYLYTFLYFFVFYFYIKQLKKRNSYIYNIYWGTSGTSGTFIEKSLYLTASLKFHFSKSLRELVELLELYFNQINQITQEV